MLLRIRKLHSTERLAALSWNGSVIQHFNEWAGHVVATNHFYSTFLLLGASVRLVATFATQNLEMFCYQTCI